MSTFGVEMTDKEECLDTEYIGVASLDADEAIVLKLRAEGPGITGDGTLVYPKGHPDYDKILEHTGPLQIGISVPVRPWD